MFRLTKPSPYGNSTWYDTQVSLVDDRIPVGECFDKVSDLEGKQDKKVFAYGVWSDDNWLCNLSKDKSTGTNLPSTSPITMEFDRSEGKVVFSSSEFSYS